MFEKVSPPAFTNEERDQIENLLRRISQGVGREQRLRRTAVRGACQQLRNAVQLNRMPEAFTIAQNLWSMGNYMTVFRLTDSLRFKVQSAYNREYNDLRNTLERRFLEWQKFPHSKELVEAVRYQPDALPVLYDSLLEYGIASKVVNRDCLMLFLQEDPRTFSSKMGLNNWWVCKTMYVYGAGASFGL